MIISDDIFQKLNNMLCIVTNVDHKVCFPGRELKTHNVSANLLGFIHKGKGSIEIDGSLYWAETGKVFFLNKGSRVKAAADSSNPPQGYIVSFRHMTAVQQSPINRLYQEGGRPFPLSGEFSVKRQTHVLHLCEQLYELSGQKDEQAGYQKNFLFQELLYTIVKDAQMQQGDPVKGVEFTARYLERQYMKKMSLAALAKMAGLSPSYYSRFFKKVKGMSPAEYLTKIRINRAKKLLSSTDATLRDIAQGIGYNDESYFSRMFKKETGISPSDYIKNCAVEPGANLERQNTSRKRAKKSMDRKK